MREFAAATGVTWCCVARNHLPGSSDAEHLCGIWIAPTPDMLRMRPPPTRGRHNGRVGDRRIVLHFTEIGAALCDLVDGDSWLLDAIFSHRNLLSSEIHEHLIERTRDGLHQRYVEHYAERARVLRQQARPHDLRAAAAVLLQAGHLAQTGVVSTDADELAGAAGVPGILDSPATPEVLEELRSRSRGGGTTRLLPATHPRPEAFDDFLLFVREAHW
jgi:hypothetical protein